MGVQKPAEGGKGRRLEAGAALVHGSDGGPADAPLLPLLQRCGTPLSLCSTPLSLHFSEDESGAVHWQMRAGGATALGGEAAEAWGDDGAVAREPGQPEARRLSVMRADETAAWAPLRIAGGFAAGGGVTMGIALLSSLAVVLGRTWLTRPRRHSRRLSRRSIDE